MKHIRHRNLTKRLMPNMRRGIASFLAVLLLCTTATAQSTDDGGVVKFGMADLSQNYILYNVDAGRFLYSNSGNTRLNLTAYWGTTYNQKFKFTLQDDQTYTIQSAANNYFLWDGGPSLWSDSNSNSNYVKFQISPIDDDLITITNTYHPNNYLGWLSSQSYVACDKTTENIRWAVLDPTAIASYRYVLRNQLSFLDASTFANYAEVAEKSDATIEELTAAINVIANYRINAKTDAPVASWSEVNMAFASRDTWYSDGNYYTRCTSSTNSSGSASLSAQVTIEEASLLRFETYGNGTNSTTLHVLVDGTEVKTIVPRALENVYLYRNSEAREVDGTSSMSSTRTYNRYFIDLPEGIHTIEWRYDNPAKNGEYFYLRNIGVLPCPTTISVNLAEPGSLGNEVLKQVNNVNDVRRLKIKGEMNDEDWARIKMMTRLVALDLSETTITSLPAKKFDNYSSLQWPFLHELVLPSGLESIGQYCFRFSYVDHIVLPETVKSIASYAFYKANLQEVNVTANATSVGEGAFARCYHLKDVSYQANMTSVPSNLFYLGVQIKPFELPSHITNIETYAFGACWVFNTTLPASLKSVGDDAFISNYVLSSALPDSLESVGAYAFRGCQLLKGQFPSSLKTIGNYGFYNTAFETLDIPASVTTIGEYAFAECDSATAVVVPEGASVGAYAFRNCDKLAQAELPTTYYTIANDYIFQGCKALKTLRLKSPTMVTGKTSTFLDGVSVGNVTLQVPDYLVSTYKLNNYWYNFGGFDGFATDEVDYWVINQPLKLGYDARLQGSPSLRINGGGRLTINGDAPMNLRDVYTYRDLNYPGSGSCSMVLANCDTIVVNGTVTQCVYTTGNVWYTMTLPFDFKVSDIATKGGALYAIRYYDGANRAEKGTGGNWKDIPADSVITTGTGFIYRTSKNDFTTFTALDNGSKQTLFTSREFAKPLQTNPSVSEAHKGWNLVGNPYLCYYNIHKLNTTAPITIYEHGSWSTSSGWVGNTWYNSAHEIPGSYKAYSLIDDDYALLPNGAFFLQCPDEATVITFPVVGRQLTSEITDQNGVKAFMQQTELRKLVDIRLFAEDAEMAEDYDQTRVVFNPAALMGYERSCDASKFAAEHKGLPQLYTLGLDATRYAINERPTEDGIVPLGLYLPTEGSYTLCISRNRQAGTILLHDLWDDTYTDITSAPYTFHAEAGTVDDRFELLAQSLATDVNEAVADDEVALGSEGGIYTHRAALIYALDGRLVARADGGFTPVRRGTYIVRSGKRTAKVVVK